MMIHPDFLAAMARERTAMLTASAAARRQARELRQARRLRLAATTAAVAGFIQLSERSRRMRFLGRKNRLTEAELRYYTDIDHHDHDEVLGAVDLTCGKAQAS